MNDTARLCDFLDARLRDIVTEWEHRVRRLPASGHSPDSSAPRAPIPALLRELCARLRQPGEDPSTQELEALAESHAVERLSQGQDVHAAVGELAALRDVIFSLWARDMAAALPAEDVRQLNRFIDQAIARSVGHFAAMREQTLVAMDRAVSTMIGNPDFNVLLPRLLSAFVDTMPSVDSVSVLLDDGSGRLRSQASVGLEEEVRAGFSLRVGEGFAGTIAARGQPLLVRDASSDALIRSPELRRLGFHAVYGAPLVHEDGIIGVAYMGSRSAYDYSADQQQLLRALALRTTSLIAQARLIRAERTARERIALLQEVTAALSEALTPAQVASVIVERGVRALRAKAGVLFLLSADGEWFELLGAHGYPADALAAWQRFPASTPVMFREAVRGLRPILYGQYSDYLRDYPEQEGANVQVDHRAFVTLPLVSAGRAIGAFGLSFSEPQAFPEDERAFMETLARQCTQALERARLYAAELSARTEAEAQRNRLRAILDTAADAILTVGERGEILSANPASSRLFGYAPEELPGLDVGLLIPETSGSAPVSWLSAGGQTGLERVGVRKDGARLPIELSSSQTALPAGRFVTAIVRDLRARKQTEAARAEALVLLDTILETAPVGFSFLDVDLRYVRINTALAAINGVPVEQTVGRLLHEVLPELAPHLAPIYRQVLRTGEPLLNLQVSGRTRVQSAEEGHWLVSYYPVRNPAGEVFLVGTVVVDFTERQRTADAQSLLVEAGSAVSQSLDLAGTLKNLASLAVRYLADYCMVDLLGEDGRLHRLEVLARDPAKQELIRRSMPYPPSVERASPTGKVLVTGAPIVVPLITPAWLSAVARNAEHLDILERMDPKSSVVLPLMARGRKLGMMNLASVEPGRMAEPLTVMVAQGVADRAAVAIDNAQLYREAQEAVRIREQLLAIVSHDLRNPLNTIVMSATLLLKREDLDDRQATGLSRIYSAAHRASRMIHDLLDFSLARGGRIAVKPRPEDFHQVVRQVVEEVRLSHPEREISLDAQGDGKGEWDPDRLAQVVANLVGNAVQHSPAGTPVQVATGGDAESVALEVRNGGPPIPAELLPELFEPFRRGAAAEKGTGGSLGLGLFIAKQLVESHGGTIQASSSEKEGTTFTVRLPRSPPRPPAVE